MPLRVRVPGDSKPKESKKSLLRVQGCSPFPFP